MADYGLDKNLYLKAIVEIRADYESKHPVHPSIKAQMEARLQQSAESSFSMMWHSAVQMHEGHRAHRAKPPMKINPLDPVRLARLLPKDQAETKIRHAEMEAGFQKDIAERQKVFDDHHRTMLVSLMKQSGMSMPTAQKIVDEHILSHQ